MTVARTTGTFLGTDETTGVTIANNATSVGAEVDMFGNNTSAGDVAVFLKYTSTVAAGSVDVTVFPGRVTGQDYADQAPLIASVVPINGTQKVFIGWLKSNRFMVGQVKNNAVTANLTNVTLGFEEFAFS